MKNFTENDVRTMVRNMFDAKSVNNIKVAEMLNEFAEVLRRIENAKKIESDFVNSKFSGTTGTMSIGEISSRAIGILEYVEGK